MGEEGDSGGSWLSVLDSPMVSEVAEHLSRILNSFVAVLPLLRDVLPR